MGVNVGVPVLLRGAKVAVTTVVGTGIEVGVGPLVDVGADVGVVVRMPAESGVGALVGVDLGKGVAAGSVGIAVGFGPAQTTSTTATTAKSATHRNAACMGGIISSGAGLARRGDDLDR